MKFQNVALLLLLASGSDAFAPVAQYRLKAQSTSLHVSVGLGPDEAQKAKKVELVAGVDYEVPDHESFRTSRRSKIDETCDSWFGALLGNDETSFLGEISTAARTKLATPVELKNEVGTIFAGYGSSCVIWSAHTGVYNRCCYLKTMKISQPM